MTLRDYTMRMKPGWMVQSTNQGRPEVTSTSLEANDRAETGCHAAMHQTNLLICSLTYRTLDNFAPRQ